jgi:hypothetical protein
MAVMATIAELLTNDLQMLTIVVCVDAACIADQLITIGIHFAKIWTDTGGMFRSAFGGLGCLGWVALPCG